VSVTLRVYNLNTEEIQKKLLLHNALLSFYLIFYGLIQQFSAENANSIVILTPHLKTLTVI